MKSKKIIVLITILLVLISCATNPFTKKKTLAFVSNDELFSTSFAQYNLVLSENKVVSGTKDSEMIVRVGQRIAVAAERWLNANGYQGYLHDYKWEYKLIESEQVNAWCMPGGKIAFYTGILPIAQNETGVAAIMGHEVAHALANHGQQRMSSSILQQAGGIALAAATGNENPEKQQQWMQAYGITTTVGLVLPFSRSHETEADKIGLFLMAIAGYNPDEAAELWKRMKVNSGGQNPPELLSTHPSNDTRIANLQTLAPKAKEEAQKYGVTSFKPID